AVGADLPWIEISRPLGLRGLRARIVNQRHDERERLRISVRISPNITRVEAEREAAQPERSMETELRIFAAIAHQFVFPELSAAVPRRDVVFREKTLLGGSGAFSQCAHQW